MEKAIFEKLQAHVFDEGNPWVNIWEDKNQKPRPNKLPYIASWAYYDENVDIHKQTLADEVIRGLNNNVVSVARNFSFPLPSTWGFWDNIHGDKRVKWLLDGKEFSVGKYRGAYITDIVKNFVGPDVMKKMDDPGFKKNVGWFFEEIDLLGSDGIEMYLFGNDVAAIFRKHVMRHDGFPAFKKKVRKCQHINSYGRPNTRFEKLAPEELGLRAESKPLPKLRFLWNDDDKGDAK